MLQKCAYLFTVRLLGQKSRNEKIQKFIAKSLKNLKPRTRKILKLGTNRERVVNGQIRNVSGNRNKAVEKCILSV